MLNHMLNWNAKLKFSFFIILFITAAVRVLSPDTIVSPDSHRYINAGLNVAAYGTLSNQAYAPNRPPEPGLAMAGVFTPFEIATASRLNQATHESLLCIVTARIWSDCKLDIPALKVFYTLEIFIFHAAVFFIGRLVFGNDIKALFAVALSFAFKDTKAYGNTILAEPSYMMASALFLLVWLYAWKHPDRLKVWFLCGLALGLTILIKSAWIALLPAFGVLALLVTFWARDTRFLAFRSISVLALGTVIVLTPLFVRNVVQLDFWGLSDPIYLGVQFAHRFAYNAMTWGEWARGWIYYLPDFGDKAAYALFGQEAVDKLSWDANSYYVHGRDVLHQEAVAAASPQTASRYLLENYFFNDPVKGAAVTALLVWRGIFVGNLVGLAAVLLAGPVLYFSCSAARRNIVILALPIIIMAGVHGLVSVSIHRYNIPLVIPYALIMAQFLYAITTAGAERLPSRFMAMAQRFLPKPG